MFSVVGNRCKDKLLKCSTVHCKLCWWTAQILSHSTMFVDNTKDLKKNCSKVLPHTAYLVTRFITHCMTAQKTLKKNCSNVVQSWVPPTQHMSSWYRTTGNQQNNWNVFTFFLQDSFRKAFAVTIVTRVKDDWYPKSSLNSFCTTMKIIVMITKI